MYSTPIVVDYQSTYIFKNCLFYHFKCEGNCALRQQVRGTVSHV